MKRRILLISLALVLIMTVLAPATALAAKPQPFYAAGVISEIEDTEIGDNVFPAGNSGRWRVVDREIAGSLSGDINDSFLMTYRANIENELTQAGNLQGTLVAGDDSFNVNGKILPLELVTVPLPFGVFNLPKLTISGHWSLAGTRGSGEFYGWVIFIPDAAGHVDTIVASSFVMDGKR
jgi:hypothetical protein